MTWTALFALLLTLTAPACADRGADRSSAPGTWPEAPVAESAGGGEGPSAEGGSPAAAEAREVPPADGEIRITPTGTAGPVYADFISFSAVSAFSRHPETRQFLHQDAEAVALVRGLHPYAIRFPGGSFTRKFHPDDDKGRKLMEGYVDLARASGVRRCILVLNLYAGSIEEARTVIRTLQEGGIEIVAVELGNEYHLGKYRDKYPSAEPFVEEAARYVAALRPLLPGVPYGIPVPSSRHVFDAEQFGARAEFFEDWTNTLADAVRSGRLPVQAVIPHFYKQTHEVFEKPTLEGRFDGVMDLLRIDSYDFLRRVVLDYYRAEFGPDIEIWITEWGVKEKQVYGNTVAEGLHVMGFLLDMAEANHRTGNAVRHSAYQKLAGPVSNAAITPTGSLPTLEPAGAFQPGTAWYAFHFLGDKLDGAQYVDATVAGATQDQVRLACFRRGEDLYVAFANRTGRSWRLDLAGRMDAVWGERPWAANGQTFWNAGGDHLPAQRIENRLTNVIPPYGYGVLKADWAAVMAR
jgi:hypothetical protein